MTGNAKRKSKPKAGWDRHDIKAAIAKRGMTLSKLALDNNLDESACRASLLRPQPVADKVISAYLDIPLHQLWPDRYDESGARLHHVRDEDKRDHAGAHRLSARVA